MKEDIQKPKVKNVTLAIAKKLNELNVEEWNVYLINNNNFDIENTLVTSTGYGKKDGEEQKTSTLRHFVETVAAKSTALIEPINPDVFHLNNEYWVSYYIGSTIYDKKFIFVPDSIKDEHLVYIKELEMEGILHS
ncbi:hypothetical protein LVD15_07400 [Fulvivirga maritima]|uniref:hypothetical protein n=1 Tax=Fulvivirga maritima TaxID=2904247 RepID=UPI001F325F06|nr:hypothetical protein [Fulvivirga maritima]UII28242.1 hypothetical protein LVD15_07400 [Fulvivirga maritima]